MTVEQRLHRVERTNRALIMALTVVAAAAFVRSPADTLRGERLEILGEDGSLRISMEAPETGPAIRIYDEQQVVRAILTHDADGTRLFLNDAVGDTRVGSAYFAHGGGGFALHGPEGKGAAVLYLKGEGSLSMIDEEGQVTAHFPGG